MRRLVALLLVSMLSLSVSAAGQSGEDQELSREEIRESGLEFVWPDPEASPFDSRHDIWIAVLFEEDSNITSIEVITQVCINTGVCFPPETDEMHLKETPTENLADDMQIYESWADVDRTAAYINWKFVLHHEDGSLIDIPEQGFGWKHWSNCWWDNGTWGGTDTHCQEEEGGLPGFAASAAAAAIAMAALMARRD